MDILRIDTDDLTITVTANGVETAYARAQRKQHERLATCTKYQWNGSTVEAELYYGDNAVVRPLLVDHAAPPVFFENKDYFFEIDLKEDVTDAYVHSRLREVKENFLQRRNGSVVSGVLNFGNELGHSELVVRYKRNDEPSEFRLGFEVFSTKLDQQSDLKRILSDIEREYPLLVLDVMRKTYSNFRAGSGARSDLVWWQVFAGIYEDFITAARFILNKPHSRLVKQERWERADRLKHISTRLEEELADWSYMPEHRYHNTHRSLSLDTAENRFFKYAVQQVAQRYSRIKDVIVCTYGKDLTPEYHEELAAVERRLGSLRNHPMFRAVSGFAGLRQESLLLQRATGYSTVYRNWIMLQRGFSLLEDMQRMETKNIADLYQIWCFLEMKNIVNDVLGRERPDEVTLGLVREQGLVLQLAQGAGSRLGYELDDGEVLELYHEFNIGPQYDLKSFTGPQRPDIALRIRRRDLSEDYMLTYLFDAKYRLASDELEGAPDTPPPDALNQMHRYRDAIYYLEKNSGARPQKEVIGGYILFPGEGLPEQVRSLPYYKAIEQVNIGAFPLRPGDSSQRELLKEHLRNIIIKPTANLLSDVKPQKGMRYEPTDPIVLIGVAKSGAQEEYLVQGDANIYHTGTSFPGLFADPAMKYFAPHVSGKGVCCYFEILGYEVKKRSDIYPPGHKLHAAGDSSSRLVLNLGKKCWINDGQWFKLDGAFNYLRYSKLSLMRAPRNGKVTVVLREELATVR